MALAIEGAISEYARKLCTNTDRMKPRWAQRGRALIPRHPPKTPLRISSEGSVPHPSRVQKSVLRPLPEAAAWFRRLLASGLAATSRSLDPAARVALMGVVAAAIVAVALGMFITSQTRNDLIVAEQRGLQTAVAAIEAQLPVLTEGALAPTEIEAVDNLARGAILGGDHVRVKLWGLDGSILYSDARDLIGQRFAEMSQQLESLRSGAAYAQITDLSDPENVFEVGHDQLIEFYIPVQDAADRTVGVFEIYSETAELEAALGRISNATWASIGLGLAVLMLFLITLLWSTVRRVDRGREAAQRSAAESAILVDAADALASSLEPTELLARLRNELAGTLRLDRLSIEATQSRGPEAASHPLSDGSWLVAERQGLPFTSHEDRLLHSVTSSLDTARTNAILYASVRDSADERRGLLERLDTAHEDERRTIVGELHDLLAGDLIRLLYGVRGIIARPAAVPDAIQQELVALEMRIAATEESLRAFMSRIRPVEADEIGLVFALEHAVGQVREEGGLDVRLRIVGSTEELPSGVKRVLLRTTEEALLNVIKHASARSVLVRLRVAGDVTLSVDDDGVGYASQNPESNGRGLGLAYARERVTSLGGFLTTEVSRLGGARVVVQIPRKGTS